MRWFLVMLAVLTGSATSNAGTFSSRGHLTLPPQLITAMDVRWDSDEGVLVADGRSGVFHFALSNPSAPRAVIPGGKAPSGFFFTSILASDKERIIAASPFAAIGWKARSSDRVHEVPFASASDVDLHDNQIAILGGNRDERGVWEPDGAIVWIGDVSPELRRLKPIMFSTPGPGPMAFCGFLGTGSVRYRQDGSLLVVPGVVPNAFLYDRTGRLVRTWQTGELGFYDRCTLTRQTYGLLARDLAARNHWINQRQIIDDVVSLPDGFGLLIRSVSEGRTQWDMVVLSDRGVSQRTRLPFSSPVATTHIRADTRGTKTAFLLFETGDDATAPPPRPPQIIIAEYQH